MALLRIMRTLPVERLSVAAFRFSPSWGFDTLQYDGLEVPYGWSIYSGLNWCAELRGCAGRKTARRYDSRPGSPCWRLLRPLSLATARCDMSSNELRQDSRPPRTWLHRPGEDDRVLPGNYGSNNRKHPRQD